MKTTLAVIGAAVILMALIGSSGLMDFHLCFKSVGQCNQKGDVS